MAPRSTNPVRSKTSKGSKVSSSSVTSSEVSSLSATLSLFGESEQDRGPTPFKKVVPSPKLQTKSFPKITLESAFSRQQAASDAVFILRMLGSQYARQGQPKGQNAMIQREIQLKKGECEAEILARDALICKFLRNK